MLVVGNFDSVLFFKRLYKDHQIIHSTEYRATTRRNNTEVRYSKDFFGIVKTLVRVQKAAVNALPRP